jgi:hypothetical protein
MAQPGEVSANVRLGLLATPVLVLLVGIGQLTVGASLLRSNLRMVREWPGVDAVVLQSYVATVASTSDGGSARPTYDAQVKFRYYVNDVRYENATTFGKPSSSRADTQSRVDAYRPGTTHRIWHRPDDPNAIRFDLGSTFDVFFLPVGLLIIGMLCVARGAMRWRALRSTPPAAVPGLE